MREGGREINEEREREKEREGEKKINLLKVERPRDWDEMKYD